jgi:putative ABC transport system ATP-binding protein
MIELKNLTKVYRMPGGVEVRALDNVNLTVEKGEFVAIMGASGSGKSTLLHMIGGVDAPTSGTVELDHENVHSMKPAELARFRRKKVGIIYQEYNLIPTLTVEENLVLPLLLDRKKPDRGTVEKLLEVLNLKDRRNHLPGQLSGGQQQRTAIGRILLEKPAVLLADEPTGNLDSANTAEIMNYLRKINQAGQTILMVTHDENIGQSAARRLVMRDGSIIRDSVDASKGVGA